MREGYGVITWTSLKKQTRPIRPTRRSADSKAVPRRDGSFLLPETRTLTRTNSHVCNLTHPHTYTYTNREKKKFFCFWFFIFVYCSSRSSRASPSSRSSRSSRVTDNSIYRGVRHALRHAPKTFILQRFLGYFCLGRDA